MWKVEVGCFMTKDNQVDIQLQNRKVCAVAQIGIILQGYSFVDKMEVLNKVLSQLASETYKQHKTTD